MILIATGSHVTLQNLFCFSLNDIQNSGIEFEFKQTFQLKLLDIFRLFLFCFVLFFSFGFLFSKKLRIVHSILYSRDKTNVVGPKE